MPRACLLLWLLVLAGPAQGQGMYRFGEIVLHVSAVPTLEITPEVARRHAITRSGQRALLNIVVQRSGAEADAPMQALQAEVSASATNPAGQRQIIALREVRDGTAIYYLGEPRTTAGEALRFEIEVVPAGESAPLRVRFEQEFLPALHRR